MVQTTLIKPFELTGIGIHSGLPCSVRFEPTSENVGIQFYRPDLSTYLSVRPNVISGANRATILAWNKMRVVTPEHVLSACVGCGLHNVIIHVSGEELPILDGSARPFAAAIIEAGIRPLPAVLNPLVIEVPLSIGTDSSRMIIIPDSIPRWTYVLEYPHPKIGTQIVSFSGNKSEYLESIAPARTYGFIHELEALKAKNLAKGGSLENALVIGPDNFVNEPRFSDEMARHKLLDMMGDFALLGRPLQAHVIAVKSGHAQNLEAVLQLSKLIKI